MKTILFHGLRQAVEILPTTYCNGFKIAFDQLEALHQVAD